MLLMDMPHCGMQLKLLVLWSLLVEDINVMMILLQVQTLLTLGLILQLKVLVGLHMQLQDGKYFMVLIGKLQEEHIIVEQQL
jgi:hypothetical protein